jgi:pimeloyl-ACP methyl ester carboxylesterase
MVMPTLAEDFEVIAVDQRGIGLSDKPRDGYDIGTLASDLVALMDALGHHEFAVYGTDTGMPIAHALAADHPERVERLVVSEAFLPGIASALPLFVPPILNARLWHLMFNQLPGEVNEALVRDGRRSSSARSSQPRQARRSSPTTRSSTTSICSPRIRRPCAAALSSIVRSRRAPRRTRDARTGG